MLYLHYNEPYADEMWSLTKSFSRVCETKWFEHPLVPRIIAHVDQTEMIGPRIFESPVFQCIGPDMLSGGVQTLIKMINQPEKHYPMELLGDNCAEPLEWIAKEMDVHVIFMLYCIDLTPDTPITVAHTGQVCTGRNFFDLRLEGGWFGDPD